MIFGWLRVMFRWLRSHVRRIDGMGVGIELREPQPSETSPTPPAPVPTRDTGAAVLPPSNRGDDLRALPSNRADISAAREAFLAEVRRYSGSAVRTEYAAVLDRLIQWSMEQGEAVVFTPHAGSQALVKFCLPGMETHIWSAWPRKVDGAKLHVLTDPHPRFPEPFREVARRELARLDGRQPKPGELPVVSFRNLRTEIAQRDLVALLSRLLAESQRSA